MLSVSKNFTNLEKSKRPFKKRCISKFFCLRSYTRWTNLESTISTVQKIQLWWKNILRNRIINTIDYITLGDLEKPIFRHVATFGIVTGFSADVLARYIHSTGNLKHPINGQFFNAVEIERLDKLTKRKYKLSKNINSLSRKKQQIIDDTLELQLREEDIIDALRLGLSACETQTFFFGSLDEFKNIISYYIDNFVERLICFENFRHSEENRQNLQQVLNICVDILKNSYQPAYIEVRLNIYYQGIYDAIKRFSPEFDLENIFENTSENVLEIYSETESENDFESKSESESESESENESENESKNDF